VVGGDCVSNAEPGMLNDEVEGLFCFSAYYSCVGRSVFLIRYSASSERVSLSVGLRRSFCDSRCQTLYLGKRVEMEKLVNIHIKKLPEGFYLATSDTIQGLVAQGRTISETIEIARDIAKKLIEA
jgi:hypothetical protein